MKINNNYLLRKLVSYGVYETKPLDKDSNIENEPIITDSEENKRQVIVDNVSDDEIYLTLETKKIEILDSIRGMLKFFVILTIISLVILFFVLINNLSATRF